MKSFHGVLFVGGGTARTIAEPSGRALADLSSPRALAERFWARAAGR